MSWSNSPTDEGIKTMDTLQISATRTVSLEGRRPSRKFAVGRVCIMDGCGKVLNSYNKGPFCYGHKKITYPRVRGRVNHGN